MNCVRLGVIGCGKVVSRIHLDALRRVPEAKVVAVADPVPERRSQAAARAGRAAAFADWRELLAYPQLDAVLICTPSAQHSECALAALALRKHLYIEKPLAADPAQAELIVRAWERSGLVAMTGFNYRHHPLSRRLREVVRSGALGRVMTVRSTFTSAGAWVDDWRKARHMGGGVLLDLAGHHVDLASFVLEQRICEVSARLASFHSEQDGAWITAKFEDGPAMQSFFSLCGTDCNRFEVYGEDARLSLDYFSGTLAVVSRGSGLSERIFSAGRLAASRLKHALTAGRDTSYQAAFSHFVAGILRRQPVGPDLYDGLQVAQVVAAAEASAASGLSCRVTELAAPARA